MSVEKALPESTKVTEPCRVWYPQPHLARQVMVLVMNSSQVEDGQTGAQDGRALEQGEERLFGHSHLHRHLVDAVHKGDAAARENFAPDNLGVVKKTSVFQ